MITQVKHLQEALQRFNPDARLEYELDVQGASPATQCTVTISRDDPTAKQLDDMEAENNKLDERNTDLTNALEEIREALLLPLKADIVKEIESILDKVEDEVVSPK